MAFCNVTFKYHNIFEEQFVIKYIVLYCLLNKSRQNSMNRRQLYFQIIKYPTILQEHYFCVFIIIIRHKPCRRGWVILQYPMHMWDIHPSPHDIRADQHPTVKQGKRKAFASHFVYADIQWNPKTEMIVFACSKKYYDATNSGCQSQ